MLRMTLQDNSGQISKNLTVFDSKDPKQSAFLAKMETLLTGFEKELKKDDLIEEVILAKMKSKISEKEKKDLMFYVRRKKYMIEIPTYCGKKDYMFTISFPLVTVKK